MRFRLLKLDNDSSDRIGLGEGLGVGDGTSGAVLRTVGEIVEEYEVEGAKRVLVCKSNNGGIVGLGTKVDGPGTLGPIRPVG